MRLLAQRPCDMHQKGCFCLANIPSTPWTVLVKCPQKHWDNKAELGGEQWKREGSQQCHQEDTN